MKNEKVWDWRIMNSFREMLEADAYTKMSEEFIRFRGKDWLEKYPVHRSFKRPLGYVWTLNGTKVGYVRADDFRGTLIDLGRLRKDDNDAFDFIIEVTKSEKV